MKPFEVRTPGSYSLDSKTTPPRKKVGRPGSAQKQKKARQVMHREKYDKQDMLEAVLLVREEGYSRMKAASHINRVKRNAVPRMTLLDRLHSDLRYLPGSQLLAGHRKKLKYLAQICYLELKKSSFHIVPAKIC
jgi:hypothetical protein